MSKKAGRPIGPRGEARERNRKLIEEGCDPEFVDITYENTTPCNKCNTKIRYISSGGCVACKRTIDLRTSEELACTSHMPPRQFARYEREAARRNGNPRYAGLPCSKCAGTTRYTSNGGCVNCVNAASVAKRKERDRIFHHDTSTVMFMLRDRTVPEAYALCPALDAYPGYAMVFTDKMPRRFIGQDVMLFPNELSKIAYQAIALVKQGAELEEHHKIITHYVTNDAVQEAWRAFHRRGAK